MLPVDDDTITITVTESRFGVMVHVNGPLTRSTDAGRVARFMVNSAKILFAGGKEVFLAGAAALPFPDDTAPGATEVEP